MQVAAPQQHRVVRSGPVQCVAGGHARLGPVGFVPSLSHDPLAGGLAVGGLAEPFQQFLEASEVIQCHALALQRPFIEVDVGVDEARHHQPAVEINFLGAGSGQVQDVIISADGKDACLSDGHGPGKRLCRILGGDGSIEEDEIRG